MGLNATENNTALIGLCKLYRGGTDNPYKPFDAPSDKWANVYLKFHIWDAEFSFVANYAEWLDIWQRNGNKSDVCAPMGVYRFAVGCKLMKMQRDDIDFVEMYRKL